MELIIKSLGKEHIDDYLHFFDHRAFCDNPEWAACYCMFYQVKASNDIWDKRTGLQNRKEAIKQINNGKLKGFLAYHNNKPIGFCNVNAKKEMVFDKYRFEINDTGTQGIIAVVCFVIDPDYRRKGVSKLLLNKVIETYSESEYSFIESYPSINVNDEASNYHGFYEMYKNLGFVEKTTYEKYSVMQLSIK